MDMAHNTCICNSCSHCFLDIYFPVLESTLFFYAFVWPQKTGREEKSSGEVGGVGVGRVVCWQGCCHFSASAGKYKYEYGAAYVIGRAD